MSTATATLQQDSRAPGLLIAGSATVGADVDLGVRAVIHDGVQLGDGVTLGTNVTIHGGTTVGAGTTVGDNVVLGKPVYLSKASTAKGGELPPLSVGAGCTIGAGTVVAQGTSLGDNSLLGDQVSVRERCTLGERVIVGRGSCVENDTTIGDRTKIQSNAYITAYMTLESDVFIAPCVITTNDNFMGRTEARFDQIAGPTIRRGARIGGGAVLLPGIDIGEEAFVGAGAVVIKDVAPNKVMVGSPARELRDVPSEELLENQ